MPAVWLIALIIISVNTAYWTTYYFTPYATEIFMLSVAAAAMLSVGRLWIRLVAPLLSESSQIALEFQTPRSYCY